MLTLHSSDRASWQALYRTTN